MVESDFRERLLRAEAAHLAALTCNKLILATAAVFAGIALLLSGLLGFLLGRLAQKEEGPADVLRSALLPRSRVLQQPQVQAEAGDEAEPRQDSVLQDPSEAVVHLRLGSKEALKPIASAFVQDLDSAQQGDHPQKDQPRAEQQTARRHTTPEDSVCHAQSLNTVGKSTSSPADMSEALKSVYANYISRWQDNASPWNQPNFGRDSRLGSRVPSWNSEASEQLTWQSSLRGARQQQAHESSGVSVVGTQLLYADWQIASGQIKFCYSSKGQLVKLDRNEEGSLIHLYKAVLDGKQDVAVRVLKLSKAAFPEEKLTELALQQLTLNGAQQLVHFYGLSRTDDAVMLVYEYVEGASMRDAIRQDQAAFGWYNGGKVIARDVAQGLAHLHSLGLEHRSFKTSRVLVRSSDSTAKIAGAGLQSVTRHCQHSRSKQLVTSFEWAAPELLMGQRCGSEADIFGLGIVLWELVTHEMPIRGALREIQAPHDCPMSIKLVIAKCMARKPEMRPTAEEVVATIQRSWNSKPDKRKITDLPLLRPALHTRRSLKMTQSQPVTPSFTPSRQPSPPFANPRGTCDSVSEMVDVRRGVAVRKGTLTSIQSAGGATSPSGPYSSNSSEDRTPPGGPRKPPTSPYSSPETYRRALSPGSRKFGSLEGASAETLRAQLAAQYDATPSASRRSSPIQRYMSGNGSREMSDADAKRQQQRLLRERKKRAKGLHSVFSAPDLETNAGEAKVPPADQVERLRERPPANKDDPPPRNEVASIVERSSGSASRPRSPKRRVRMAAELAEALTTELSLTDVVERQRSQQTADRVGSSRRRKEHSVPAGPAIAISTPTLQMARLEGPAHTEEPIELRPFGLSGPSVLVPTEGSEGRSAVEQKVSSQAKDQQSSASARVSFEQSPAAANMALRLQSAQNPFSVARPDQSWHDVETPKLGVPDAKPRTADAAAASQSPTAEARHKSPRSERTSQDANWLDAARLGRWRRRSEIPLSQLRAAEAVSEDSSPASSIAERVGAFSRFPAFRRQRSPKPARASVDGALLGS